MFIPAIAFKLMAPAPMPPKPKPPLKFIFMPFMPFIPPIPPIAPSPKLRDGEGWPGVGPENAFGAMEPIPAIPPNAPFMLVRALDMPIGPGDAP